MRWTGWFFLTAVFGLAGSAAGFQPGCTGCGQGTAVDLWGAEACASPAGHVLVPGCCQEHRRCCDNAWAGYCDHRARVEDYWSRAGTTGAYARCRPCRQTPMAPCASCEPYSVPVTQPTPTPAVPTPAIPPAPPAPGKNTRNIYNNRLW